MWIPDEYIPTIEDALFAAIADALPGKRYTQRDVGKICFNGLDRVSLNIIIDFIIREKQKANHG